MTMFNVSILSNQRAEPKEASPCRASCRKEKAMSFLSDFAANLSPEAREERKWIRLAQQGTSEEQADSIKEIIGKYEKEILTFCIKKIKEMGGSVEEGRECSNVTFSQVWTGIGGFDPKQGSFRNWLYRIAEHRCIDEGRRQSRQPRQVPIASVAEVASAEASPQESAERKLVWPQLCEQLERECRLNTNEMLILTLHYGQEMSFEDIALVAGISPENARQCHKRLKDKITKRGKNVLQEYELVSKDAAEEATAEKENEARQWKHGEE